MCAARAALKLLRIYRAGGPATCRHGARLARRVAGPVVRRAGDPGVIMSGMTIYRLDVDPLGLLLVVAALVALVAFAWWDRRKPR